MDDSVVVIDVVVVGGICRCGLEQWTVAPHSAVYQ